MLFGVHDRAMKTTKNSHKKANPIPENAPETAAAQDDAPQPAPKNAAETPSPAAEAPAADAERLAKLTAENAALKDQYLRSVADLENYRRRVNREKEDLRKYAVDTLLEEFLPALDNLRLGLDAARASKEGGTLVKGFEMVAAQMRSVLADHGLTQIEPLGKTFDPNEAEAAAYEPSETVPDGTVSQVRRAGYRLHDRLLRPAIVVVSSGKPV